MVNGGGDFSASVLPPELALPATHPLAGRRAWQCNTCQGIFFPSGEPDLCPYCEDDGA